MASRDDDTRRPNRDSRLTVRFTEEERDSVLEAAASVGIKPATLYRAVILDFINGEDAVPRSLVPVSPPPVVDGVDLEAARAMCRNVNGVANNLNQLTRIIHKGGGDGEGEGGVVVDKTPELVDALRAVAAALADAEEWIGGVRRAARRRRR